MEWTELSSPTPYAYDRNGCLHYRVGSVLPGGENWRGMVPDREGDAHQLLGATRCNFSNAVLCPRAEQHSDPTENGQYNSHLLHQPVRGHSLSPPEPTSKRTAVVVHEQEHYTKSSPSSGEAQCDSRRGVQMVMRDRTDWKLCPQVFQIISNHLGPLLFVSRLSNQLPQYVSWRPDPGVIVCDAFSLDWAQLKGYAIPPWNLIGKVLAHAQVRTQKADLVLVTPL